MTNGTTTKSDAIRSLAREGLPVSEIARRVGVRYQHARNVLDRSGMLAGRTSNVDAVKGRAAPRPEKPVLSAEDLIRAGFRRSARWTLTEDGRLALSEPLPKEAGVYAFVQDDRALYVGVASMGLSKRFVFYMRPGQTQTTSIRLNARLKEEIAGGAVIEVFTASPEGTTWNGLPVCGVTGLEAGLIQAYGLPWNIRGAR